MSRKKKMSLAYLRNVFCYHILTSEGCQNYGLRKPRCIWLFMIYQYQFIELKVMVQNVLRWPWASFQWNVILHVPEHFELIHIYTFIHSVCSLFKQMINGVRGSTSHKSFIEKAKWNPVLLLEINSILNSFGINVMLPKFFFSGAKNLQVKNCLLN